MTKLTKTPTKVSFYVVLLFYLSIQNVGELWYWTSNNYIYANFYIDRYKSRNSQSYSCIIYFNYFKCICQEILLLIIQNHYLDIFYKIHQIKIFLKMAVCYIRYLCSLYYLIQYCLIKFYQHF